jgi:TatD DNase family protein
MLVDTHAHLDFPEYESDRDQVIENARKSGVDYIINIGSGTRSSIDSVALAAKYPGLYTTIGIHPHDADKADEEAIQRVEKLAGANKVVAVGEIGLDYYRNYSQAQNQRSLFVRFLKLAKNSGLPMVLHSREAQEETIKIISDYLPLKAAVHCFSGDAGFLKTCLDLGFFVSFTCNVTYKKADKLREVVKLVPMNRLMLETDCPYLSPEGFRGKRNEPAFVKVLAEEVARIKNTSFEEMAEKTTANAREFFRLK